MSKGRSVVTAGVAGHAATIGGRRTTMEYRKSVRKVLEPYATGSYRLPESAINDRIRERLAYFKQKLKRIVRRKS